MVPQGIILRMVNTCLASQDKLELHRCHSVSFKDVVNPHGFAREGNDITYQQQGMQFLNAIQQALGGHLGLI